MQARFYQKIAAVPFRLPASPRLCSPAALRSTRYAVPHRTCQRHPYSTSIPSNASLTDPTRPDLHYHLVDPPTPLSSSIPAFALSFLSSPPPTNSSTVIGWLPAAATGNDDEAGLNDFKENRNLVFLASRFLLLIKFFEPNSGSCYTRPFGMALEKK